MTEGNHSLARDAYDELASRYDERTGDWIHKRMRRVSLELLLSSFREGDHVLELGCGTGEEAVTLAEGGVRVLATDVSSEMIRVTENRARERGVEDAVATRRMGIRETPDLVEEFEEGRFDGAYASFSLGYEPSLNFLPETLGRLIREGGSFVSSVRNRVCLFDIIFYGSTLRPHEIVSRWRQPNILQVSDQSVPIRSYTLQEYETLFERWFEVTEVIGVPVLLPPPELEYLASRLRGVFTRLVYIEDAVMTENPFNILGDHIMTRMRRASG